MAEAPLSEQLEYAIQQIVCRNPSEARHQDSWGRWVGVVRLTVTDFVDADLLSAFKRLRKREVLRLTKPDSQRYHGSEYSGKEADDDAFFFTGRFNASITDEGRSHWDHTEAPRTTVFISHIGEERAVALKFQALIQEAFGNAFPVFVSSDPMSLGGGEEWYHFILDNLAKARIVFVLLSPESADRPWIAFESGFGVGKNSRVIPIACRDFSFDSLDFPLKGLQGYYLQQLTDILKEISTRMAAHMGEIDIAAAWQEINDIQRELPAKKMALELEPTLMFPKWICNFYVVNHGNRDVEPLEVTIWFPSAILYCPFNPAIDRAVLEVNRVGIDKVDYIEINYRNYREPTMPDRFSRPERLVSCLAPGMRSKLQLVSIEVRYPLEALELQNPVKYKIVARNVRPVERIIKLGNKLAVLKQ